MFNICYFISSGCFIHSLKSKTYLWYYFPNKLHSQLLGFFKTDLWIKGKGTSFIYYYDKLCKLCDSCHINNKISMRVDGISTRTCLWPNRQNIGFWCLYRLQFDLTLRPWVPESWSCNLTEQKLQTEPSFWWRHKEATHL